MHVIFKQVHYEMQVSIAVLCVYICLDFLG